MTACFAGGVPVNVLR